MGESIAVPEGDELAGWALPLVFDRLIAHYHDCGGADPKRASEIAGVHGLLWQAVITGDVTRGSGLRRALAELADASQVPAGAVDEADKLVCVELLAVVAKRFRNSRRLTKAYCLVLEEALRQLSAGPPAPRQSPPAHVAPKTTGSLSDWTKLATALRQAPARG